MRAMVCNLFILVFDKQFEYCIHLPPHSKLIWSSHSGKKGLLVTNGAANLLFTPRLHADKGDLESLILVDRNLRWVILFCHQIEQQEIL